MESPTVTSPKLQNAIALLRFAWRSDAFTASEAMAATGLTRSTVIGQCDELVEKGWVLELADSRTDGKDYRKGRPARRYLFNADRAAVVGVDAGTHTVTTRVANLRGEMLAEHTASVDGDLSEGRERIEAIDRSIDDGITSAGIDAADVLCLVVGVPAPVDSRGGSPEGANGFWRRMNPDLGRHLRDRGWTTIVENDANLAAIAERTIGAGVGIECFVTLLAGERFGAGCVVDGRLLRGSRGGAGESNPLTLIEGITDADGIGAQARRWAREAREAGTIPPDSELMAVAVEDMDAETVFFAAAHGDDTAVRIVERIAERLSRICALLGGLLDVERIILAGGIATALTPLLESTTPRLTELVHLHPPELLASTLGREVVTIGAVSRAQVWVEDNLTTLVAESSPVHETVP